MTRSVRLANALTFVPCLEHQNSPQLIVPAPLATPVLLPHPYDRFHGENAFALEPISLLPINTADLTGPGEAQ